MRPGGGSDSGGSGDGGGQGKALVASLTTTMATKLSSLTIYVFRLCARRALYVVGGGSAQLRVVRQKPRFVHRNINFRKHKVYRLSAE